MERKIMNYAQNAWAEIRKAEKLFERLNSDDATYIWKHDTLTDARELFSKILSQLNDLETFFSDGDKLLPQEEQERLEHEG